MNYSQVEIWSIIGLLALGTFIIRFSFLGAFGRITLPPFAMRLLRYTPVAILPGMVAPLVLWPTANGGSPDAIHLVTAAVALGFGVVYKNVLISIGCGAGTMIVLTALFG